MLQGQHLSLGHEPVLVLGRRNPSDAAAEKLNTSAKIVVHALHVLLRLRLHVRAEGREGGPGLQLDPLDGLLLLLGESLGPAVGRVGTQAAEERIVSQRAELCFIAVRPRRWLSTYGIGMSALDIVRHPGDAIGRADLTGGN